MESLFSLWVWPLVSDPFSSRWAYMHLHIELRDLVNKEKKKERASSWEG